jgi:hypothetical protein
MRSLLGIVCAAGMLALGGCVTTAPIENVINAPIVVPSGKTIAPSDVATAIERAGRALGWELAAEAPGLFGARLRLRNHLAVVKIEYDQKAYSIRYADSANLEAKDGLIHRAYNEWIENLDRAIRAQLEML